MQKLALLMMLASPLAAAQEADRGKGMARFSVRLPADARLWIDDTATAQTGPERHFTTPPLQMNVTYYYTLRVELRRDGRRLTGTKEITVRAGETTRVEFPEPQGRTADVVPRPKTKTLETTKTVATLSEREQALVGLTNQERKKAGLRPLQPNAQLSQAARAHSANMARQGKLDHTLDDMGPADRMRATGYRGFGWGENIAYGMPTPAAAMEVWMDSKGHRANILNESFDEIGVGIAVDERGVPFYTQVFGTSGRR